MVPRGRVELPTTAFSGPRFEELANQVKAAQEKGDPNARSWISQSAAGDRNSVYYVSQPQISLAGRRR
jgi:hypothetical protein